MCPQFPSPLLFINCNFRECLQNHYMRYNMYSGRPWENSLQRRRVEGRNYLYENITTKLWLWLWCLKVFNNLQPYRYASLEKNSVVLPFSMFYRFRLLQFHVLQIPAFTIPGFTDSGFYNSMFYRFRLL